MPTTFTKENDHHPNTGMWHEPGMSQVITRRQVFELTYKVAGLLSPHVNQKFQSRMSEVSHGLCCSSGSSQCAFEGKLTQVGKFLRLMERCRPGCLLPKPAL